MSQSNGTSRPGVSLGDLYSKCVQMVNENKVSTKNAFDLKLIDHMEDVVGSFMPSSKPKTKDRKSNKTGKEKEEEDQEYRFHEASCTIEASARIYACRVDCVHGDTYRVLGGLNSSSLGDEDDKENEDGKGGSSKRRRIIGVNTIEKNEKNITQANLEMDEQNDPTFRRMAAAFDAGGAKGLLLGHLPIAEDLSLVFYGDVSLTRALSCAGQMFDQVAQLRADEIGLGEPEAARARLAGTRLCPDVDSFRRDLYGKASMDVSLPEPVKALLGAAIKSRGASSESFQPAAFDPLPDIDDGGEAQPLDSFIGDDQMMPLQDAQGEFDTMDNPAAPALPLVDAAFPGDRGPSANSGDDAIAFDELFEKFCGGQFEYFDSCWSKGKGASSGVLQDASSSCAADGAIVAAGEERQKDKSLKRPLFDLSGLDKPVKPIETEPAHKHQLSERAAQWQLHKDVPPYMIDRITMPSWPTWSKCDFACLGLRPHLMLKLVRKAPPPGDGPHGFADLFSTVVVENPDAFPWLAGGSRGPLGGPDDDGRLDRDADYGDDIGDEDFANGLPAHLDVDPHDLFLGPEDKVVPPCDDDDDGMPFGSGEDEAFAATSFGLDLVDQPASVGQVDIGYSRNSKFVDVKLVKKHLWDIISDDITAAKDTSDQSKSSFQGLVSRCVSKLPSSETENLSVQVCFICALHLCNEKNLEMNVGTPLLDFDVIGPKT